MQLIGGLLPPGVVAAEAWKDDLSQSLFPEEASQLKGAVASRMREFATARSCARQALCKFGLPPMPILSGANREPLWPRGIVGSITHCPGYRAAAISRQSEFMALGIDAEIHDRLPADVIEHVCKGPELAWLSTAPDGTHWDRVLFSAKESIYKAWFPLTRKWLGFEDVSVIIDPAGGTFHANLSLEPLIVDGHTLQQFTGRFLVCRGLILTAVAIARNNFAAKPQEK